MVKDKNMPMTMQKREAGFMVLKFSLVFLISVVGLVGTVCIKSGAIAFWVLTVLVFGGSRAVLVAHTSHDLFATR